MSCRICQYNQVKDLDRAILAGVSPTSLSQKYSFSKAELQRHQEHLQQKMALAQRRFHDNLHQGLFCKLHTVMEMVLYVVRGAKNGEDFKLFLQASREFTRIISLMHKMAAKLNLDPEFIYHLMASPQWDLQEDSLLPHAIQAMSDTRHTLKVNLFAPCPEPEPEPAPEPALSSPRETQNSKLETLTAEPGPNPLPEVSASLARQPLNKPETGARPPAT